MKGDALIHPIEPVYDTNSEILILGSFPSVQSRLNRFFYGHPRNRFWQLLASLYKESAPKSIESKKELLLSHHIALWDILASCRIHGSADSSICQVSYNDLSLLIRTSSIRQILLNGQTAGIHYRRYLKRLLSEDKTSSYSSRLQTIPFAILPSTSPANASCSLQDLSTIWGKYLGMP